jgi:hypothetical protein
MKQKIDLEVQWELHTRFNKPGLFFSSLVHLSDLYHYYKYFERNIPLEKILAFKQPITEKMLSEIKTGSIKVYEKTKRIISIGTFWLDDEWLLMFTYRFELEFIKDFLLDKGLLFPDLDLHGLCEEMKAASKVGKKNKQQFQSAVNAITKNSSLPFLDIWFEADQHPRQPIPNCEVK